MSTTLRALASGSLVCLELPDLISGDPCGEPACELVALFGHIYPVCGEHARAYAPQLRCSLEEVEIILPARFWGTVGTGLAA